MYDPVGERVTTVAVIAVLLWSKKAIITVADNFYRKHREKSEKFIKLALSFCKNIGYNDTKNINSGGFYYAVSQHKRNV